VNKINQETSPFIEITAESRKQEKNKRLKKAESRKRKAEGRKRLKIKEDRKPKAESRKKYVGARCDTPFLRKAKTRSRIKE
jgi:hypothetical protein